jgi:protein ImuB
MRSRYFSLWCPSWPVTSSWLLRGSKPETVTVVFDRDDNKAHVAAVCPDAYKAGVRRGMRKRTAESLVPDAYFVVSDVVAESSSFSRVVDVVRDMVPHVSLVRPGRLECSARGPSRYFGGEVSAAREVHARVKELGIDDVFVGVADTRFASFVAARVAPYVDEGGIYCVEGSTQEFLKSQPLSLLDAPQIVSLLERVGLSTLGDIATMSAGDMLARFGDEGARVHALVTGHEDARDDREIVVEHEDLSEEYISDDPLVTSEQAAFVSKKLARDLSQRLSDEGLMCSEVEVTTYLSSGEVSTRTWRVETTALEHVIASRVLLQCDEWLKQKGNEEIEVSFADAHIRVDSFPRGITRIVVRAAHVASSYRRQISLFGSDVATDTDALRVIDRMKALVGESSVVELVARGGRMPGEAVAFREFSRTLDDLTTKDLFSRSDESDLSCALYWPGAIVGKTPMCSYEPGAQARLLDADNDPVRVHATGIMKTEPVYIESPVLSPGRQEVTNFAGPWPLEDYWWDEKKRRRVCRFQIVCEAGAYLVLTCGEKASIVARY